ncbi:hypothetical protein [Agromyces sp. NPDC056965]|uniref:hypothetical protein n=1 Tax=Agromyces sp. NPDC056965 TaxID=3345983 RepID=UPI003629EB4E
MTSIDHASRAWQPPVATAAAVIVVLCLVALMPEVCPAISPAPPSCMPDAREAAAIAGGTIVVIVAAVGVALTYLVPVRSRHRTITAAMIAVALAGVTAIIMAVFASGFILI